MLSFDIPDDILGVLYCPSAQEDTDATLPRQEVHSSRVSEAECSRHVVTEGEDIVAMGAFGQAHGNGNAWEKIPNLRNFQFKRSPFKIQKSVEPGFKYRQFHKDYNVTEDKGSEHGEHRSQRRQHQYRGKDKPRRSRHQKTPSRKENVASEAKGFSKPERQFSDDPAAYNGTYLPNAQSFRFTDADAVSREAGDILREAGAILREAGTIFRESSFGAMVDDKAAAFLNGVYGQRVDVYPCPGFEGTTRVQEQMDENEHTHDAERLKREKIFISAKERVGVAKRLLMKQARREVYIVEERLKREKLRLAAKEREKAERLREEAEKMRLLKKQEQESKERESARKAWERYSSAWSNIMSEIKRDGVLEAELIPWPVASGKLEDVDRRTVEHFYLSAPVHKNGDGLYKLLKTERVKWHPDKMQQRWGQLGKDVIVAVNTTFQTIDSMWAERRG